MSVLEYLEPSKQKKLWLKLRNDAVIPVVDEEKYKQRAEILDSLQKKVQRHDYHPQQILGFLGLCKSGGATRFVPVFSIEDFSVYYAATSALQKHLCFDLDGVYGAWWMSANHSKITPDEEIFGDYVFEGSLSTKQWIKNWASFSDLLRHECEQADESTWFHVTDIANFYDSIDLSILEQKIKRIVIEETDALDVLLHFLRYWNRTIRGYNPSSKGIPQEIVQDASRILANFFLKESDERIIEICKQFDCKYIRWADDIIFVGRDKRSLEIVTYLYATELHKVGLNLNASKTKCYTKRQIEEYRCLDILKLLSFKEVDKINQAIDIFKHRVSSEAWKCREDTVAKNLLSLLTNKPIQKYNQTFFDQWNNWKECDQHKNWLKNHIISRGFEMVGVLDSKKLNKLMGLYPDKNEGLAEVTKIIIEKPYTSPKAELLKCLSKLSLKEKEALSNYNHCKKSLFDSASESRLISEYSSKLF